MNLTTKTTCHALTFARIASCSRLKILCLANVFKVKLRRKLNAAAASRVSGADVDAPWSAFEYHAKKEQHVLLLFFFGNSSFSLKSPFKRRTSCEAAQAGSRLYAKRALLCVVRFAYALRAIRGPGVPCKTRVLRV